jgi:hypothetical protein
MLAFMVYADETLSRQVAVAEFVVGSTGFVYVHAHESLDIAHATR